MAQKIPVRVLPRIGLLVRDAMRVMGLQAILGDGQGFEVVVLSGTMALDGLDLVVIDSFATPQLFELLAVFRRSRPEIGLVVLGAESDFDHIERVIGAGARGYLSHSVSEAELRMAIDVVRDGSVWAPRKVLAHLLRSSLDEPGGGAPGPVQFTKREREVLKLLMMGHPNREIAAALGVDEGTVKAHMGRLMRKAGVDNRTALSMRAIERRWA